MNIAADTATSVEVRKWTHTFLDDENEDRKTFGQVFAAIHNLGTRDVLVSYRDANGVVPIPVRSEVQDGNLVLVRKQGADNNGSNWLKGETIIIIG